MQQQRDSFNYFIDYSLQQIVDQDNTVEVTIEKDDNRPRHTYSITFDQVSNSRPFTKDDDVTDSLFPNDARLRNITYSSSLFVDIKVCEKIGSEQPRINIYPRTLIGELPVMTRSSLCNLSICDPDDIYRVGECPYDQGGYFIINGKEKVLIAQERLAYNRLYIHRKITPTKILYTAEVKSVSNNICSKLLVTFSQADKLNSEIEIKVLVPRVRTDIPLIILFRALGALSDEEIISNICYDPNDTHMIRYILASAQNIEIGSTDAALDFIGNRSTHPGTNRGKRIAFAANILASEFIPHMGTTSNHNGRKIKYLGYVVNKLLSTVLNRVDMDDRDHYGKKNVDLAGPLLSNLFKSLFRQLRTDMARKMRRSLETKHQVLLKDVINKNLITNGMNYSISTGNWTDSSFKFMESKAGISQDLNRLTYVATLSHLRRLNTPMAHEGKMTRPRQLHNTSWGILCPAETPEGQSCGLVKNLALMAYVTANTACDTETMLLLLYSQGMDSIEDIDIRNSSDLTKVFFNGAWVGYHSNPITLVNNLRIMRREGGIRADDRVNLLVETSIAHDCRAREISIRNDPGRIARPLLVVETCEMDQTLHPKEEKRRIKLGLDDIAEIVLDTDPRPFTRLLDRGFVEYIDVDEEECTLIAMTPDVLLTEMLSDTPYARTYTHCEMHPSMILGVSASLIPFPHHNQSPRNTYQAAMGKQAIGISALNVLERMDTFNHLLYYPQKPLCITHAMNYMSFRDLPAGQNAIAAIACYSSYNQEDSVILNQSAIDRGMFRSTYYRTFTESDEIFNNTRIEHPGIECQLDQDGITEPGIQVLCGDIVVGKTTRLVDTRDDLKKSVSKRLRPNEAGYVDKVMVSDSSKGTGRLVKVRIRSERVPQIGDKFASRHGQKGTCGITYRTEDMPFTAEGITPDLILNPHAIPSRMTIGHLIETLLAKVCALKGREGDATAFTEVTVEDISTELKALGYQSRGLEVMYNGYTGRKLQSQIFIGPTYYQRLKHLVDDKIHSRCRGPVNVLTRQPMDGRANDGGLRFGEMERDCLIAHGMAYFLQERMLYSSDAYALPVCDLCGIIAITDIKNNINRCQSCKSTNVSMIQIPYSAKLLFQELMTMHILPRLITT